jgi:hypothetical protein
VAKVVDDLQRSPKKKAHADEGGKESEAQEREKNKQAARAEASKETAGSKGSSKRSGEGSAPGNPTSAKKAAVEQQNAGAGDDAAHNDEDGHVIEVMHRILAKHTESVLRPMIESQLAQHRHPQPAGISADEVRKVVEPLLAEHLKSHAGKVLQPLLEAQAQAIVQPVREQQNAFRSLLADHAQNVLRPMMEDVLLQSVPGVVADLLIAHTQNYLRPMIEDTLNTHAQRVIRPLLEERLAQQALQQYLRSPEFLHVVEERKRITLERMELQAHEYMRSELERLRATLEPQVRAQLEEELRSEMRRDSPSSVGSAAAVVGSGALHSRGKDSHGSQSSRRKGAGANRASETGGSIPATELQVLLRRLHAQAFSGPARTDARKKSGADDAAQAASSSVSSSSSAVQGRGIAQDQRMDQQHSSGLQSAASTASAPQGSVLDDGNNSNSIVETMIPVSPEEPDAQQNVIEPTGNAVAVDTSSRSNDNSDRVRNIEDDRPVISGNNHNQNNNSDINNDLNIHVNSNDNNEIIIRTDFDDPQSIAAMDLE